MNCENFSVTVIYLFCCDALCMTDSNATWLFSYSRVIPWRGESTFFLSNAKEELEPALRRLLLAAVIGLILTALTLLFGFFGLPFLLKRRIKM